MSAAPDLSRLSLENLHGLLRHYPAASPVAAAIQAEIDGRLGRDKAKDSRAASAGSKGGGGKRLGGDTTAVNEKAVQHQVRRLLEAHGAAIYDTSQPFAAKITPGVPDLIAFLPRCGLVFVEVKAPGGRATPAQLEFRERCLAAGVHHVLGGVEAVRTFLEER